MAVRLRQRSSSGIAVYRYGKKGGKRKKRTRELRGVERLVRRSAMAGSAFSDRYLREHRKSNRKKRDGWLRDFDDNVYKASKKGSKRFKARRVLRRL